MATDKMTNVKAIASAIETLSAIEGFNPEVIEKLGNIKASYEKKGSGTSKKATAAQQLNDEIKTAIVEVFKSENEYLTISDVCGRLGNAYTSQKLSSLMRAMANENDARLVRHEDTKGRISYRLA